MARSRTEQIVFRVTDIVDARRSRRIAGSAKQDRTMRCNRALTDDIARRIYCPARRIEIGVTINQAALRQVDTGGARDDN